MERTKLLFALVLTSATFLVINACSLKKSEKPRQSESTSISKSDYNELIALSKNEQKLSVIDLHANNEREDRIKHFISVTKGNFELVKKNIVDAGGEIIYADKKIEYIHFKSPESKALKLLELVDKNSFEIFIVDKPVDTKHYTQPKDKMISPETELILNDLSSLKLMKADELITEFKSQYGIDLDCSSSTIAVFDTGIDISRTDVFQDRIIHLRSIRTNDLAFVTEASEEVIEGVTYLTASLQDVEIKIEKSPKLQQGQAFYLGLIIEKSLKGVREGFENYDLNQDGKDTGIFPIVVFKDNEGNFAAYINVNDQLTYGEQGDSSIEDENLLMDFNWVAQNVKDRYASNADPALSYYKYTTRMDIIESEEEGLTKNRSKGLMNLAINFEPGIELSADGKELSLVSQTQQGQNIYRVGIAGYDLNGHGTHVTGIAAGNFQTAPEYSSACTKAKIINVANIGTSQHSSFYDELLKLSKKHKNIVFNFSFGNSMPVNDIQGPESKLMDLIAKTYNIPFVKAAGNEGPGIKSHGTTTSKYIIAVANYMSSNARQFFGHGNFLENKVWPDSSSSRGPTHDGALKPDIGAPGWVLSSVPLSKPLNTSDNNSFQYWPGTSMASPNVASMVALLYDALEKSGLSKLAENAEENSPATTLDKLRKSIINSAIPYDDFTYTSCSSSLGTNFSEWCKPEEKIFKFNWLEGGAGRINAVGAWKILTHIQKQQPIYLYTQTKSVMPGYNQNSIGYFNIGDVDAQVLFTIKIDSGKTTSELTRHERFVLKIPADVDWLSFNRLSVTKEKIVDVFGGDGASVKLFVLKDKLIENGRLKPGLHHTVIRGYNVDDPEYFDVVFPVTIIGYHTTFDGLSENFQFGVSGFTPSTMFQRFFIPVTNEHGSTLLNLSTSPNMPGDLSMHLYHQGIEIEPKDLGANTPWVLSTSEFGEGRNNLKFVINNRPKGLYEVVITADYISSYLFDGIPGGYFQFNAGEMALDVEKVTLKQMNNAQYVMIENAQNPGSALRVSETGLTISELKHESSVVIKNKEVVTIPITVPPGVLGLIINTFYYGFDAKTDIDIELVNIIGSQIGQSANESSNEMIATRLPEGNYLLKITGYNIPAESEEFGYQISYVLSNPITLINEFKSTNAEETLKAGFRWNYNKLYSFKAKYDLSKVSNLPVIPETKLVFNFSIKAFYNNENKSTTVFDIDLQ